MELTPSIPPHWEGFEIRYRHQSAVYEIEVRRRDAGQTVLELDGNRVDDGVIALESEGRHQVTLWLSRTPAGVPAPAKKEGELSLVLAERDNPQS